MTMAINNPPTSANRSWRTTTASNIMPNPHSTNSSRRLEQQDAPAPAFEENVLRNNTNIQPLSFPVPLAGADGRPVTAAATSTASPLQRVPSKMARASFEIELPYQPAPPPPPPPSALPIPQQQQQPRVPSDSSSSLHNKISTQTTTDSSNNSSTEKSWVNRLRLLLRNPRARNKASSSALSSLPDVNMNNNSSSSSSAAPYHGGTMETDHHHQPPSPPPYRRTRRSLGRIKNGGSEGLMKTRKHAVPAHIPNANGTIITDHHHHHHHNSASKNSYSVSSSLNNTNIEIHSTPHSHYHHPTSPFQRIATWFTGSSSQNNGGGGDDEEGEDLHDFDESEWTPPDSSYGAAIPVGGWIPKNIRRSIEFSLVTLAIVALVYAVVTTSIRVTEDHHNNNNSTRSSRNNNNDRYITYGDDDKVVSTVAVDDLVYNNYTANYTDDAYSTDDYNNGK